MRIFAESFQQRTMTTHPVETMILFAILCVACAVVSAILITRNLDHRGVKTPFLLLRWKVLGNIRRYRQLTVEECGRPGMLYYLYLIPINAVVLFAILAVVFQIASR